MLAKDGSKQVTAVYVRATQLRVKTRCEQGKYTTNGVMTLLIARRQTCNGWVIYESSQMTSRLPVLAVMSAISSTARVIFIK